MRTKATRPGRDTCTVTIDVPRGLLQRIDHEAARIGIARQEWIILRLTDLLDAFTGTTTVEPIAEAIARDWLQDPQFKHEMSALVTRHGRNPRRGPR